MDVSRSTRCMVKCINVVNTLCLMKAERIRTMILIRGFTHTVNSRVTSTTCRWMVSLVCFYAYCGISRDIAGISWTYCSRLHKLQTNGKFGWIKIAWRVTTGLVGSSCTERSRRIESPDPRRPVFSEGIVSAWLVPKAPAKKPRVSKTRKPHTDVEVAKLKAAVKLSMLFHTIRLLFVWAIAKHLFRTPITCITLPMVWTRGVLFWQWCLWYCRHSEDVCQ